MRKWLLTCNFRVMETKKGVYYDGHERPDVKKVIQYEHFCWFFRFFGPKNLVPNSKKNGSKNYNPKKIWSKKKWLKNVGPKNFGSTKILGLKNVGYKNILVQKNLIQESVGYKKY